MGIFGALSTAVTGLTAQSFALENISGNIANSQTTGYKRTETSFEDMVIDGNPAQQVAGSVVATSRATNTVQGDVVASQVSTNMALNGDGFFVVKEKTGQVNGQTTFGGSDLYTRRGDFTMDSDGYLVNGAGYYLEGQSIDPSSGNPQGTVGVVKVSNGMMPAAATSEIDYQLNLPQNPTVTAAVRTGSNLFNAGDFNPPLGYNSANLVGSANLGSDTPASTSGTTLLTGSLSTYFSAGNSFKVQIGSTTKTFQFYDSAATPAGVDPSNSAAGIVGVDLNGTNATSATLATSINTAFPPGNVASVDSSGHLKISATNTTDAVTVTDGASGAIPSATYGAFTTTAAATPAGTTDISGSLSGATPAITAGTSFTLTINGVAKTFQFFDTTGDPTDATATPPVIGVDLAGGANNGGFLVGKINAAFGSTVASLSSGGLKISGATPTDTIQLTAGTTDALASLGLGPATYKPSTSNALAVAGLSSTSNALASMFSSGQKFQIQVGTQVKTFEFYNSGATPPDANPGAVGNGVVGIDINGGTVGSMLSAINGALPVSATLDGSNHLKLVAATGTDAVTVTDGAGGGLASAGLTAGTKQSTNAVLSAVLANPASTLTVQVGNSAAPGAVTSVDLSGVTDQASLLTAINTALGGLGTASYDATGHLKITAAGTANSVTLGGSAAGGLLGGATATAAPTPNPDTTTTVNQVTANQNQAFLDETIEGGSITAYSENGSPTNIELRWAKNTSVSGGVGTDTWSLYYMTDAGATGNQVQWQRVPQTFVFNADGSLASSVQTNVPLTGLTINGVALGNISLNFGTSGLTQGFTDTTGTASVSTLNQNGYPAGKFTSVTVSDAGRVVASYSNGQTQDVAQVVTAQFSGADYLKRMDGGTFAATNESGTPIISANPSVSASALESSNTDISTEFSSLIVTQQAYAAGTKIVTAANDMMQQALNMIR